MATSKYFNNYNYRREQDLVDNLVMESIKIYGHDLKYLPTTFVNKDPLFGEDPARRFDGAVELEMYVKNVEGFEGEGDFLSKFGLEIRDQITFTVSRRRWDQVRVGNSLDIEDGYKYYHESANTDNQSSISTGSTGGNTAVVILEDETAGANSMSITSLRPNEGDLIYFPMVGKIFEVADVQHESFFYQTGRLQTYDLNCHLFTYSGEKLNTGDPVIDAIEDRYSTDMLNFQLLLEDDSVILNESTGSMINEFRIEDMQPTANNEYFENTRNFLDDELIVDFSELNPWAGGD